MHSWFMRAVILAAMASYSTLVVAEVEKAKKPESAATKADGKKKSKSDAPETPEPPPGPPPPPAFIAPMAPCFNILAAPMAGSGAFANDRRYFYMIGAGHQIPVAPSAKAQTPVAPPLTDKASIYKVDLQMLSATPLLSLKAPLNSYIFLHGQPVTGLTTLMFKSPEALACEAGQAQAATLSLIGQAENDPLAVMNEGIFGTVLTERGTMLTDYKRWTVLDMDARTLQTRAAGGIPLMERPLFSHLGERRIITWHQSVDGKSPSGLVAYRRGKQKSLPKLKVEPGDKVLQVGPLMAILRHDRVKGTLTINEFKQWTAVKADKSFVITLSKELADKELTVSASFAAGLIMVWEKNVGSEKPPGTRKVYLIDYVHNKPVTDADIPADGDLYYAGLSGLGKHAVLGIRTNDPVKGVKTRAAVYSAEKKEWKVLALE